MKTAAATGVGETEEEEEDVRQVERQEEQLLRLSLDDISVAGETVDVRIDLLECCMASSSQRRESAGSSGPETITTMACS